MDVVGGVAGGTRGGRRGVGFVRERTGAARQNGPVVFAIAARLGGDVCGVDAHGAGHPNPSRDRHARAVVDVRGQLGLDESHRRANGTAPQAADYAAPRLDQGRCGGRSRSGRAGAFGKFAAAAHRGGGRHGTRCARPRADGAGSRRAGDGSSQRTQTSRLGCRAGEAVSR